MTAAERFRLTREAHDLSQRQVASILEIRQPLIARIELGKKIPTTDWLRDAADKLGWPREALSPDLKPRADT